MKHFHWNIYLSLKTHTEYFYSMLKNDIFLEQNQFPFNVLLPRIMSAFLTWGILPCGKRGKVVNSRPIQRNKYSKRGYVQLAVREQKSN